MWKAQLKHYNCICSIIDLVMISNPHLLISCSTIPLLSTSNYYDIHIKWKKYSDKAYNNKWFVLNYRMVGWNKVYELIDSLDRNITMSDYINTIWENWQNNFLLIYNYNGIDAFQDWRLQTYLGCQNHWCNQKILLNSYYTYKSFYNISHLTTIIL